MVKTSIAEKADIIFSGAGLPLDLPSYLQRESTTKLVPIVSSARAAKIICEKWKANYDYLPDAIVVEGPKAGGHLGYKNNQIDDANYSLEHIVPEVVAEARHFEKLYGRRIPVIAAGGLYTGEDISGSWNSAPTVCSSAANIEIIASPVGMPGRAIAGEFIRRLREGLTRPKKCPFHCIKTCDYTKSPYCIIMALYNAAKGNLPRIRFRRSQCVPVQKITSVRETIASLQAEFRAAELRRKRGPLYEGKPFAKLPGTGNELRVLRHERRTNRAETARSHRRIGEFRIQPAVGRIRRIADHAAADPRRRPGFGIRPDHRRTGRRGQQQQAERNRYLRLRYDTIGAWLFSLPIVVIAMLFMHMPYGNWIMLILSLPVLFFFGRGFFVNGWKQLRHRQANMDTLVALSTSIAFLFSLFNTVYPQFWLRRGLEPHVYYEAACVIIAFVLVGKLLEERAKSNTSSAIKRLIGLQPTTARLVRGDHEEDVPISALQVGDRVSEAGDKVVAGTINSRGTFVLETTGVGSDTLLARIIRMVQQAQGSKAPVQRIADRIAAIFVPTVIGIALLTFALWLAIGGMDYFSSREPDPNQGRDGLEQLCRIDTVVMDKTGTLTEGRPSVVDWIAAGPDLPEYRNMICAAEMKSEHPLASAIVNYLSAHEAQPCEVASRRAAEETDVRIETAQQTGASIVYFGTADRLLAVIVINDTLKATTPPALDQLRRLHIDIAMLTGDSRKTAAALAERLGIRHYRAEVLPDDKDKYIQQLQREGKRVAMVGDGINDSQALARADVSIAMGHGTDIAMDVAMVTLMNSDLLLLPKAYVLSRKTVRLIRQNLFWAFIYNLIGIPIAAGVLYPLYGILMNPMLAGAAMAFSSVSVVANSLRLKWMSTGTPPLSSGRPNNVRAD
ncbi:unnamed protein product [Mycena citricolor]|uniref:Uncharacterized protein n=1 Tax=Mycena citricolor TaxID=2018698 RepID=A0AAD2HCC3_9AGAR|nr:unnamed protein product [Mycena citricolor]